MGPPGRGRRFPGQPFSVRRAVSRPRGAGPTGVPTRKQLRVPLDLCGLDLPAFWADENEKLGNGWPEPWDRLDELHRLPATRAVVRGRMFGLLSPHACQHVGKRTVPRLLQLGPLGLDECSWYVLMTEWSPAAASHRLGSPAALLAASKFATRAGSASPRYKRATTNLPRSTLAFSRSTKLAGSRSASCEFPI